MMFTSLDVLRFLRNCRMKFSVDCFSAVGEVLSKFMYSSAIDFPKRSISEECGCSLL